MENPNVIAEAQWVFDTEIRAIQKTKESLGEDFQTLVDLILKCSGKVVLTGIGKPGHIAKKIAASFASLGTPSFFMHPSEALHGDLGMVEKKDIVILISYSGESEEVTRQLPTLKEIGCTTVAITGNRKSTLARECLYHFFFPAFEEACYLHLAPTSSTTALLVLGDALAVVASREKNYSQEEFGLYHPAGALGKKLFVKVSDLMHGGCENAVVREDSSLRSAIIEMSAKRLSMVTVVDASGSLKGIITDGDLRRMLERGVDVYSESIAAVMTRKPITVSEKEMAVNALQKMNDNRITGMPVLDHHDTVVGAVLMQDILKAGIVR